MLEQFREGTEAHNKEREKIGLRPLEIAGWVQAPAYDAQTQRLDIDEAIAA